VSLHVGINLTEFNIEDFRIFVVDDNDFDLKTLTTTLKLFGFDVVGQASSAEEAITRLFETEGVSAPICDLVLLDINLPEMNGDELCEQLSNHHVYSSVPVIMITGDDDVAVLEKAYNAGAVDFIRKPFNRIELNARVMSAARNSYQQKELRYLAHYDRLTGLVNRTLLLDRLETSIKQARRNNTQVVMLFIDLDNFKSLNDTLGHDMGDIALKITAERLLHCTRNSDTVARYGGDEFVILLTNVDPAGGRHHPQRIVDQLNEKLAEPYMLGETDLGETSWHLGGSVGIATFPDDADNLEMLLKIADMKMYKEKTLRKNEINL